MALTRPTSPYKPQAALHYPRKTVVFCALMAYVLLVASVVFSMPHCLRQRTTLTSQVAVKHQDRRRRRRRRRVLSMAATIPIPRQRTAMAVPD